MKITREPLGENLERFEMTLERSDWYGEYDKQLRQARREMAVPGFRRGQAPLGLVARRLGGEEWSARLAPDAQGGGTRLEAGARVTVTEIDGAVAVVAPAATPADASGA